MKYAYWSPGNNDKDWIKVKVIGKAEPAYSDDKPTYLIISPNKSKEIVFERNLYFIDFK